MYCYCLNTGLYIWSISIYHVHLIARWWPLIGMYGHAIAVSKYKYCRVINIAYYHHHHVNFYIYLYRFFIQSWTYMLLQKTKEIYNLWSFLLGVMGWWWCVRLFDARSEIGIKQEYAYIRTQVNNLLTVVFWKRNVTWYTILSYLLVEKLLHTHAFAYKASQLY